MTKQASGDNGRSTAIMLGDLNGAGLLRFAFGVAGYARPVADDEAHSATKTRTDFGLNGFDNFSVGLIRGDWGGDGFVDNCHVSLACCCY